MNRPSKSKSSHVASLHSQTTFQLAITDDQGIIRLRGAKRFFLRNTSCT